MESAPTQPLTLSEAALRRVLATLCLTQIVSWRVLYYAITVLSVRITEQSRWSQPAVTGAFSAALVTWAVVGIGVGRWLDRHGPRTVMTAGSILGPLALVGVAMAPSLQWFIAAWIVVRPRSAGSKSAAAEATNSELGNRSPSASAANSSASTSPSTVSRTLLAHITSPLVPAGTLSTPLPPSARPLSLSRPAASAAWGTRGLPASAAPSVFRLAVRVVSGRGVGLSAVVLVGRAVDLVLLGIGQLLPGSPQHASLSDGR